MHLEAWQWIMAAAAAFLMGLGKGGLPGIGNVSVAIFAMVFDARASVGLLLPVLIGADVIAVSVYRRHAEWGYVRRLLPWMLLGVVVGYFALNHIDSHAVRLLIGGVLLSMTGLHFARKAWVARREGPDTVPHSLPFRSTLGVIGGFSSMVANAAGPVGALYFLSVGLPKYAYIGTAAWTFFMLNLFKVPFQVGLGLIDWTSLGVSLRVVPAAMLGAAVGPLVVRHINQRVFEALVWLFVVVAGVDLLFDINMVGWLVNLFGAQ